MVLAYVGLAESLALGCNDTWGGLFSFVLFFAVSEGFEEPGLQTPEYHASYSGDSVRVLPPLRD